eukprot:TRINITY_DN1514_c0_g1_i1.p1 TRINITY_DN1514_c0_g1~~TRINITY_DN1514_c0_g1_i1.p1  ORF type:complete len:195 (-),score=47.60 TRINITY_DN1514_c0_g1_i1:54-638(-)
MNRYEQLKKIWLNETCAPELLQYESELIEDIQDELRLNDEKLQIDEEDGNGFSRLEKNLLLLHYDRVKYILTAYLRVRLKKIEKYIQTILKTEELLDLLSDKEKNFAEQYALMIENHFKKIVLNKLPEDLQSLTNDDMLPLPNLETHIICRVKEDIGEFLLDNGVTIEMDKNNIMIIKYKSIQGLFLQDRVELI